MSGELREWARAWAAAQTLEPDVVVTCGAGSHLGVLAGAFPRACVLSCEQADRGVPGRAAAPNVVAVPPERFETLLVRALTHGFEVLRAAPPPLVAAGAPGAAEFAALLAHARRTAEIERTTLRRLGATWLDNLERNMPVLAREPGVTAWNSALAGKPVLVAGAGPSLQPVLPGLRANRRRFVLLAATSALRPLWRAGLVADAAVVIEGRECLHHVEGIPHEILREIVLFAESNTHPAHLELPFRQRVLFHGAAGSWLEPFSGRGSLLPTGGNVGTAALVLAWLLGGCPVLCAGLDFALAAGAYYASGSGSRAEEHAGAGTLPVAGWRGELLQATPELVAYREQTEMVLDVIARADPRACFVCAGRGGARVRGMAAVDWDRIAPELPPLDDTALPARAPRETAANPAQLERAVAEVEARLQALAAAADNGLAAWLTAPHGALTDLLLLQCQDEERPDPRERAARLRAASAVACSRLARIAGAARRACELTERPR
ncbi:MAG: DUF115 domain-containing protein [Acidobacteria bacterium]|nr:DUF115 domain-containing protein [Acidobacteriota bacterium]